MKEKRYTLQEEQPTSIGWHPANEEEAVARIEAIEEEYENGQYIDAEKKYTVTLQGTFKDNTLTVNYSVQYGKMPAAYAVGGAVFALRKKDAAQIVVEAVR